MKPTLRTFVPDDTALVKDSWIRSSREHGIRAFKRDDVTMLMDRNPTVVCCEGELPDLIYGWICHGTNQLGERQLWWMYVKQTVRRQGLGLWLVRSVFKQDPFVPMAPTEALRGLIERLRNESRESGVPESHEVWQVHDEGLLGH